MGLKDKIVQKTKEYHNTKFRLEEAKCIPTINTKMLTFGCNGWIFDATVLYIDMRHSTKLLDEHRRNVVAKLHMSYYNAIVSIARSEGGEIRSFNGDSLLVFFMGADKCAANKAVRCALKMKFAITKLVNPELDDYTDINFGIGVDAGSIVVTKVGTSGDETTKDLIWLGDAVNKSTKISDVCEDPYHVGISEFVYSKLDSDLLRYTNAYGLIQNVWTSTPLVYNNKYETIYKSSCVYRFE